MIVNLEDRRDLAIHAHLERMCIWLGDARGIPRRTFYSAMLRYMRGLDLSIPMAHAIASGFRYIMESPAIDPPISMEEIFDRAEAFIENDETVGFAPTRASPVPSLLATSSPEKTP